MTTTTSAGQIHGQSFGSLYVDLTGQPTSFWAASTARQLMRHFGLGPEWKFDWDNAKRRYGCCKYSTKRISMSTFLTPHRTREQCLNTILHEIAHALVGPGHGHGREWQRMAVRVGAPPVRCGEDQGTTPKPPWMSWCLHCNTKCGESFRRTNLTGRYHLACGIRPGRLGWRANA
jgi:predicted SprT family Zn-dependent metalloprotease